MLKQASVTFIALLGLNSAAVAQTGAAQTAIAEAIAARTCDLPMIADTAPLEQVSGSDLMTVPVAINGTNKQFLLDLALRKQTEMSESLRAEFHLPQTPKFAGMAGSVGGTGTGMAGGALFGSSNFTGAGGMGMPYCDVASGMGCWLRDTHVRITSFGIGNVTGHQLQFMVAGKGDIERSAPYAGLLTGDFFRNYDVELDFAGKRITWLTPTKCTDPNQVVFWSHSGVAIIPVRLADDGRLSMTAIVKGHLINAEIDTSSERTVMRRDIAEQYVDLKADKGMVALGDLKDGLGMQIYVSNFPEITFGTGVTADNVPVLIQDYSMRPSLSRNLQRGFRTEERIPDLTVGMDVLQQLHMYVVPGQGRVYVTSAE